MIRTYSTALLGTAMTLLMTSTAPAATQINIDQDAAAALTPECQTLAQEIGNRGNMVPDDQTSAVMDALNTDNAEACVSSQETLAATDAPQGVDTTSGGSATQRLQLEEQATIQGQANVIVPKPEVDVAVDAPQVTVRKAQPEVSVQQQSTTIQVEQPQPTVSVQIPQIIVQVEIPAPRIFIQSVDPEVQIAGGDPQVEVQQAAPRVTVRQAEPRLEVDLGVRTNSDMANDADTANAPAGEPQLAQDQQTDGTGQQADGSNMMTTGGDVSIEQADAQVNIVQAEGAPTVNIQSAEAQVDFRSAEPNVTVTFAQQPTVEITQTGEPQVTYETSEERQTRLSQQQDGSSAANAPASAAAGAGTAVTVSDLLDYEVISADDEGLGEPEAFIERNGRILMIVEEGGFLGLGENAVAVPLESLLLNVEAEQLKLRALTEEELEEAANFEYSSDEELQGDRELTFQ